MDGGADDHYRGLISFCPHSDAERWKVPTWPGSHIWKPWHEYMEHPELDLNYSLAERTRENKARLRRDFDAGLSDDPELLRIMRDMHIESVRIYGAHPQLSP